jgi:hypothetical protein
MWCAVVCGGVRWGQRQALIKDFVGPDIETVLETVKKVIEFVDGKKKATEIENNIIKISVKVILLWKKKELTVQGSFVFSSPHFHTIDFKCIHIHTNHNPITSDKTNKSLVSFVFSLFI